MVKNRRPERDCLVPLEVRDADHEDLIAVIIYDDRLRVEVPRQQNLLKGHLPRVIYYQVFFSIRRKILGRSTYSTNLYQMLIDNDLYDPGVW